MAEIGKLSIARSKFEMALRGGDVTPEEFNVAVEQVRGKKGNTIFIDLLALPTSVMDNLLRADLSPKQERMISMFVIGPDEIIRDQEVGTPKEFHVAIQALLGKIDDDSPNAEVRVNGWWYPIRIDTTYQSASSGPWGGAETTRVEASAEIAAGVIQRYGWAVREGFFLDDEGNEITMTLKEALARLDLRPYAGGSEWTDFCKAVRLASKVQDEVGSVLDCVGDGLEKSKHS